MSWRILILNHGRSCGRDRDASPFSKKKYDKKHQSFKMISDGHSSSNFKTIDIADSDALMCFFAKKNCSPIGELLDCLIICEAIFLNKETCSFR